MFVVIKTWTHWNYDEIFEKRFEKIWNEGVEVFVSSSADMGDCVAKLLR